jgi:hypothetical protein
MDFSDKDYGYYLLLVVIAAIITAVSYLPGGIIYLAIIGVVSAFGIGYFSKDEKSALFIGAFFGFAIVGIDMYFGPGLFVPNVPETSDPILTFLPFIRSAVILSVVGGVLSGIGYTLRKKR